MRTVLVLLCLSFPAALFAQAVNVAPSQCVWHAGNDPRWASPGLDDSSWLDYTNWKLNIHEPDIWIRCRASVPPSATPNPAISLGVGGAYEVFVNGHLVGHAGDLHSGDGDPNHVYVWPIPRDLADAPVLLAVHAVYRSVNADGPAHLEIGEPAALEALRDSRALAGARDAAAMVVCYIVVGALGLGLVGFYLSERSRHELLLLGLCCVSFCVLRMIDFFGSAQMAIPLVLDLALFYTFNTVPSICEVLFFFRISGRRIPLLIVGPLVMSTVWSVLNVVDSFIPMSIALPLSAFLSRGLCFTILLGSLAAINVCIPWFAFFPLHSLPGRSRLLAILCCVWMATDAAWCMVQLVSRSPHGPDLFSRWHNTLAQSRGYTLASIVIVLIALLLREQRQIAEERAVLAGEMQAARSIQSMLAPETLTSVPGVQISVAFHPMRDVGGDFYLCRPLTNGVQRLLVGDVSGKGTAAAMTATLLIGAAEGRESDSPSQLLAHINRVLCASHVGGFATCLCADLTPDGEVAFANAGHLAPYCRGEEITVPSGLPLGISPDVDFQEVPFTVAAGDTLTFVSDGIVEAQTAAGELFGFERTRQISTHSAEEIARAALSHGQEDDITVLTLTFAPVEVAHP